MDIRWMLSAAFWDNSLKLLEVFFLGFSEKAAAFLKESFPFFVKSLAGVFEKTRNACNKFSSVFFEKHPHKGQVYDST